jgi:hypothetical protein
MRVGRKEKESQNVRRSLNLNLYIYICTYVTFAYTVKSEHQAAGWSFFRVDRLDNLTIGCCGGDYNRRGSCFGLWLWFAFPWICFFTTVNYAFPGCVNLWTSVYFKWDLKLLIKLLLHFRCQSIRECSRLPSQHCVLFCSWKLAPSSFRCTPH